MTSDVPENEIRQQLRNRLNADKVKMWLPPYTTEDGQKGKVPQELIARYSEGLKQPEESVANVLEELRLHALDKLATRKKFERSGVASLKVKLAGNLPDGIPRDTVVEISLKVSGQDLKHVISTRTGVEVRKLKLVAAGHVVEDDKFLHAQYIKNQSQVMALCLGETEAEAQLEQERISRVAKTKEAAELLSVKEDGGKSDNYYLQITDQTGKRLDLPTEERRALVLAMTLHEKGRAAVKKRNFSEGLLLLLEADQEFQKCRSDILQAVDNYALVCLDIVWCYLCLKNVNELPDAEARLKTCDECFRKSYGPNLERLAIVKGETGTIKSLFMRLHLLQGILAFHQSRKAEAMELISRAEHELSVLQVNEDSMTQVMEMGFSQQEARLGLRACEGNVQLAVAHIVAKREARKEQREREKEENRKKKLAKQLGNTAAGESVNVDHFESLQTMGYKKGAAAEALRQANNDILQAIQVLQDNPELLTLTDLTDKDFKITDEVLSQVTGMGFDLEAARAALYHHQGNVRQCIETLLSSGGTVPQLWFDALYAQGSGSYPSQSQKPDQTERERQEKEAIDSIVPDIPENEEDYLDLALDDEAQFVQEYKALLTSAHTS